MDAFEDLVRDAPVAMLVVSAEGRIRFANAAAERLSGYALAELVTMLVFELIAPEDLDERPLDNRRLEGGATVENERPIQRKDGTRVWVKSTTRRADDGRILLWLRDLSEQRRLEHQLLEAQKLETVGLLAAGLAHDLNNLLTVVTGHAELLCTAQEPRTQDSAACIGTAADRAAELTRKLLAFGRRQALKPRPFELAELVVRNRPLMASMAGERIELRIENESSEWIDADPAQVEQALWNLVTNACQAMEHGGRLTVRVDAVLLDDQARETLVRPRPDPRFVALSVEDTGPGIGEETLRRVFDPFFTTKQSGSGLGLSVVHGVVGQSGGLVRVRSTEGQGATFEMCFPRTEPRLVTSIPPRPRGDGGVITGKLLLVEDQDLVRTWLVQALGRRGFEVVEAPSGEEALGLLASMAEPPLALITDISLPRLSGPDLARRVRQRLAHLPVLFISGYAREEALRALPAGSDLLLKPFTAAALVERLTRLCGRV